MSWSKSLALSLAAAFVGLGMAYASGASSRSIAGAPLPVVVVAIAFGMQWVAWGPAARAQTERFFDLWGAATYLTCLAFVALFSPDALSARDVVLLALVSIWALRLGAFLFTRVLREGSDARFDRIKRSAPRFLLAWSLQGLWVSITLLATLVSLTAHDSSSIGAIDVAGVLLCTIGLAIEGIADHQKSKFKGRETSQAFISTGLWAWSRHPNYFGEIVFWCGVAAIACADMIGWGWLGLSSPLFVYLLLRHGSGIPILEARGNLRFGHQAKYQAYKRDTPLLILRRPRDRAFKTSSRTSHQTSRSLQWQATMMNSERVPRDV